jgi:hypothetical protein
MKTTTAPKKAASSRTLRRQFLAALKPSASEPLSLEEHQKLHELVEIANKSNHELVEHGFKVNQCREMLKEAEAKLAATRKENQAIHADIAPLFHRLPTV